MSQRKSKVIPKLKLLSDFTSKKLEMTNDEDQANIDAIKQKMQSIDTNQKKKNDFTSKSKVMGTFVVEQYFEDGNMVIKGAGGGETNR
jgi:hypothetical protein